MSTPTRSAKDAWASPSNSVTKAQIVDNAEGVILDYNAEVGNPADAPQLVPAIARITTRTGHTGINGARHPTHRHFDGERPFPGRSS